VGWARWLAAALSVFEAGYMVVDGSRALVRGDYITPKTGPHAGKLGPWAIAVKRIGIDPRSSLMKGVFVAYGLAWLGIVAAFLAGVSWGWAAMLVAAIGSLWYLIVGTLTSAAVVILLLLPGARP
jgi:hypothetical protein